MAIRAIDRDLPWWKPVLFGALAGGLGWGIRGQYGHESGAMVPGLLLSLSLVCLVGGGLSSFQAARAVALGAIAMGIGGSMTYGQTIGLTQDASLIGNWAALRWGMLGLAIKGGVWIGFAATFLGIGLSGKRYRPWEMAWCLLALLGAFYIGKTLLNSPFDPANRVLPSIYFSADWHWQPGSNLKPRAECWGGLLFALVAFLVYVRCWRGDALALRLGTWGVLAGALGFPLGQSVQAFHAWNPELFAGGPAWWGLARVNWWNAMEQFFGTVMGAVLGLGLWASRKDIAPDDPSEAPAKVFAPLAYLALSTHLCLLLIPDLIATPALELLYDPGLVLVTIPLVVSLGGRFWPCLVAFPVILMPIAIKTLRATAYNGRPIGIAGGWIAYVVLPTALTVAAAIWLSKKAEAGQKGDTFARHALFISGWMYFLLNWALLNFPLPFTQWPNGNLYVLEILGLTFLALARRPNLVR